MPASIGITGSRNGLTAAQREQVRKYLANHAHRIVQIHHGDCVGADAELHQIARDLIPGVRIIVHPPSNHHHRAYMSGDETRPEKKYADRNMSIVNSSHILLAFPAGEEVPRGSGTWLTVRFARAKGKPHIIFRPDGAVEFVR